MREKSEWHRIAVFGKTAEFAANYLHKGSQVYIGGQLQTRKWQDKDGQGRYTTEIVVRWPAGNIQLTSTKSSVERTPFADSTATTKKFEASEPSQKPEINEPSNWNDYEDDIPF